MESQRLQKIIADAGLMSRRAAEKEIEAGRVTVNGVVASLGQKADPDADDIRVAGRRISLKGKRTVTIMLNKPRGYVTTASDERGRPTVLDLCRDVGCRVYPIGRLDMDSDGLLLLTNDGELANKLTHPRHTIPKIYHVTVSGSVDRATLKKLSMPMTIDGYEIQPVECEIVTMKRDPRRESTVIRMTLYEGRNRQIRKMCELCDLTVERLTRVAIGTLTLGTLKEGEWKPLKAPQIDYLRKA